MTQSTFTFRVNEDLKDNFTAAAKSLDRSGAQLLRDYMREIVRRRQKWRNTIRVGELQGVVASQVFTGCNQLAGR